MHQFTIFIVKISQIDVVGNCISLKLLYFIILTHVVRHLVISMTMVTKCNSHKNLNWRRNYNTPNKVEKHSITGLAYSENGKEAAARFASTLIRSALEATATLRPLLLHCRPINVIIIKYYKMLQQGSRIIFFKDYCLVYLSNEFKGTWESNSRIWFCILQEMRKFSVRCLKILP